MTTASDLAAKAISSGKLEQADIDDAVLGFLGKMEQHEQLVMAQAVLDEFAAADLSSVRSRSGYLLGMLRQRVRKSRREELHFK